MYNCALGHAHMDIRRDPSSDPTDELSAIVGMSWLPPFPQAQKLTAYWAATKEADKWKWNREDQRTTGPMNPLDGKTAMLCLTRGGRLRLIYQTFDMAWHERAVNVDEGLFDLEHNITHASFAPDRGNTKHLLHLFYVC